MMAQPSRRDGVFLIFIIRPTVRDSERALGFEGLRSTECTGAPRRLLLWKYPGNRMLRPSHA